MPVGTKRLLDVTSSTILCPQLNRFEPVNVSPIEEHKPNDSWSLVNFEGMTRQNSTLDDDAVRVDREERASTNKTVPARRHFPENENVGGREHDWRVAGHDDEVVLPVSLVFVFVAIRVLE